MGIRDGTKSLVKSAVRLPTATVVGFWRGLTYPFKGMAFVFFRHPKLVRFWIWPILITTVLLGFALWGGWEVHESAVDWVWSEPTGEGFWSSVARFFHGFIEILVLLVLWAIGFIVVVLFTNVIAAPFNDLLSEEVEHLLTGKKGPDFSLAILLRDSVRTIGLEIMKLGLYAVIMIPLFILAQLLPVFGQVVYSIFAFLFTALYFSVDYVDWPASRRNRSVTYRFSMLHEHFMPMFGFGTGVWLFLFIPLVNLLFMPAAVAGGTMLFLDLEGASSPRPSADPVGEAPTSAPPIAPPS